MNYHDGSTEQNDNIRVIQSQRIVQKIKIEDEKRRQVASTAAPQEMPEPVIE